MAASLSTVFHRPFTLSTISSAPPPPPPLSSSSSSSSPSSLPSSISFTTPNSRSKAMRKATLIYNYASKDGLPAPSERPNPIHFLRKTTVLLTASASLLGCLSSPCFAKTHNPFASVAAVETSEKPETIEDLQNSATEGLEKEKVLEEYRLSNPDDVDCLKAIIGVKINLGKLGEAIPVVERLMELDPTSRDWPLMRAHMRIYEGDVEGAKLAFEEIIEHNSLDVEAYHGLTIAALKLKSEEELEGVVERIQAAIEKCKKEKKKEGLRDFKLLTAHIRVVEEKYEEALEVYEKLVKEEPRDFRPYLFRGIIYMRLNKKDEAEKQFEKYRRLVPKGHPYQKLFDNNTISENFFPKKEDNSFDKR